MAKHKAKLYQRREAQIMVEMKWNFTTNVSNNSLNFHNGNCEQSFMLWVSCSKHRISLQKESKYRYKQDDYD